jgi:formylmethanofuran dehydrogenase subunit B
MIVIDPERTETAELADLHLQLRPGMDIYAVTGLAAVLVREDLIAHCSQAMLGRTESRSTISVRTKLVRAT